MKPTYPAPKKTGRDKAEREVKNISARCRVRSIKNYATGLAAFVKKKAKMLCTQNTVISTEGPQRGLKQRNQFE